MFYQIFFSLKVRRSTIIGNKYGIYQLPHELPNDLRLRTKGHEKLKTGKNYNLAPSPPPKINC